MKIRAFIALEIPTNALNQIILIRDQYTIDYNKIHWEDISKLHITLKFLGDVEEELLEIISTELEKAISKFGTLELEFEKFGFFKAKGIPKIFWIGIKENFELEKLASEIDILCSNFGFEREKRKFHPHITLLRIKDERDIKKVQSLIDIRLPKLNFTADKITLFQSILKSSGSIYQPIKSFITK